MMAKILVCTPIKPTINQDITDLNCAAVRAMAKANPEHKIEVRVDQRPIDTWATDSTPWSKVCRARNRLLDEIFPDAWDYLLWIDADVVAFPADMPTRLIDANPVGVTAPMVMVEGTERFYDFAAFIIRHCDHIQPLNRERLIGRNLQHEPPYWPRPQIPLNVEMDCVGTVTMVPTWIYSSGHRYEDHPAFTDHYPICLACRKGKQRVIVCRDVIAYHADLPKYDRHGIERRFSGSRIKFDSRSRLKFERPAMRSHHEIGTVPSKLRGMARSLGVTIEEAANRLRMSPATLARRLQRPEQFTVGEALAIVATHNIVNSADRRLCIVGTVAQPRKRASTASRPN